MKNFTTFTSKRKVAAIAATALCATTVLAACGSDSGDSGSAETVKVMTLGPFDAKGFSLPSIAIGAQAGVDKVNASGGINGRQVELITCNDNNDPNTAAGCARKAVQEKVVAVVGAFSTFEPQIVPVLEKAGIPMLSGTPVANFTSPVLYPVTGGAASQFFGLGKSMATNPICNGKVGGLIEAFAATEGAIQLFKLGVEASGGTYTGTASAPQGARDFAPAVSAASAKSSCIGVIAGPQIAPVIVAAANQNSKIKLFGSSDSILPSASIEALGEAADGIVVVSNYQPVSASTDTPGMKEYIAAGLKVDPEFAADQTAASAYLGPQILQKVLEGASKVDASSAIAGLNKLKGFDTGLGPIVDFTTPNPTKTFSRLPLESPMYQWVAKDGQYVSADEAEIDISGIYEAAAQAGQ